MKKTWTREEGEVNIGCHQGGGGVQKQSLSSSYFVEHTNSIPKHCKGVCYEVGGRRLGE